jgi:hypothetical protein
MATHGRQGYAMKKNDRSVPEGYDLLSDTLWHRSMRTWPAGIPAAHNIRAILTNSDQMKISEYPHKNQ